MMNWRASQGGGNGEAGARAGVWVRGSGTVMGIYDREYYRGESGGSAWFWNLAPACKSIILINVGVFLLQNAFHWDEPFIREYLAASPEFTLRHYRIYQLLTATFVHSHNDILHILFNMIFLWIVGREMEAMYGSRDFLAFYLSAAVVSSFAWVLIKLVASPDGLEYAVGASGAVLAVVTLFTLYYPKRELLFFFVPMPMWLILAIDLTFPLLPLLGAPVGSPNVAVEAHLAGAAYGFVFKQFDLRWSRLTSGRRFRPRLRIFSPVGYDQGRPRAASPSRTSTSVAGGARPGSGQVSVLPEEQLDARLDEVLAKIAREGREALTEEEQRVLQEASRRARIRRSDRL
jgi:membrane associated rhomboid family serine protease